jgi:PPM family protein phosphatase
MSRNFETSHRASQGARKYQEDACVFARLHMRNPAPVDHRASTVPVAASGSGVVAVLADGMGGHVGGERASTTACRGFLDALAGAPGEEHECLQAALDAANEAIRRDVVIEPRLHGMGCTLIGAVFGLEGLRWVSVGDSRLFLFRRGELYQLNEDHSLAPLLDQLAAQGELTREQALHHPRRHHLRSALTGDAIELVDLAKESVDLLTGDCIVLASDGIDTLPPDAIADVISQTIARGSDTVAQALIDAVDGVARPGQDNTTVMAIVVRD